MQDHTSPLPLLIALAGYALALGTVSLGIFHGIGHDVLEPRPALVGLLLLATVAGAAGALTLVPMRRDNPLRGALAVCIVGALLLAGFLFGPGSALIVAGVPLAALTTTLRVGVRAGRLLMAIGVLGSLCLGALTFAGWLPLAPALVTPDARSLTALLGIQLGLLVAAAAVFTAFEPRREAIQSVADPVVDTVVDTVLPSPPRRATRTGSFSLSELAMFDQQDLTPNEAVDEGLELQKLESLGVLAGGVAHDFNNLLMSILGSTSLALNDLEPDHPAHASLREIETASRRARDLVGQLLAYSGRGNIAPEPVDLNRLVAEMGDLLRTAMNSRAEIAFEPCSGTPIVLADPTQLRQVVMNLITNASDATRDGRSSAVELRTGLRSFSRAELNETLLGAECSPGAYVELTCTDRGEGMDAQTLQRIFDPFYTTKRTGRGLGLAAVLGIVRRCGGTLAVASTLGEGTTFRVLLPYAAAVDETEDLATENTSTARGWSPQSRGHVLVVDDDPVVRRVTARMVARLGFEVVEAEDGASAIDAFEARAGDVLVVLLDLTMPGMSGLETLEALRERDADVPVVLTSGYTAQEASQTDGTHFLQKPYTLKQLTRALDRVMRRG